MARIVLAIALLLATIKTADANRSRDWRDCESDQPDLAIDGCARIIETKRETRKNLATAYHNRGNAYYNKSKYAWAIYDYEEAIKLNPKLANAYNNRGLGYYHTGNHPQAIVDFSTAIQLDPAHTIAYYNRGLVYESEHDYKQAKADFRKAVDIEPVYEKAKKALERLDGPALSAGASDAGGSVGQLSRSEPNNCFDEKGNLVVLSCSQYIGAVPAARRYASPTSYNFLWLPAFRKKRLRLRHRQLLRGHKSQFKARVLKTSPLSHVAVPRHRPFRLR